MKKKIYLASPFFNEEELKIYKDVIQRLRARGYEVYVPQEFEIANAWDISNQEWGRKVFENDVKELALCDVVMTLNFGLYSDSGTAWESGFGYALGLECVQVLCGGFNPDYSLMMINGCHKVVDVRVVENWESDFIKFRYSNINQK